MIMICDANKMGMINNEDFDAPAQGLSAREMGVCLYETV